MKFCCEDCFDNEYIKEYIEKNCELGNCDYTGRLDVLVVSVKELGAYFRSCLDKAYEPIDDGTGITYWDGEYLDECGNETIGESIYSIFVENECILSNEQYVDLLEDAFNESGPSIREIQQGADDLYADIYNHNLAIRDALYVYEECQPLNDWQVFKSNVEYYNRFFDLNENIVKRQKILEYLRPYILEHEDSINSGLILYRARRVEKDHCLSSADYEKEIGSAPGKLAKANRMSPSSIACLYLADSPETAIKETRSENEYNLIGEYELVQEACVIDLKKCALVRRFNIFR